MPGSSNSVGGKQTGLGFGITFGITFGVIFGITGRAGPGRPAQAGSRSLCSRWWSEYGVGCTRRSSGTMPRRNM